MPSMEESFEAACNNGKIPGAVLVATNKEGTFKYEKVVGFRSLEGQKTPLQMDAVMTMASCTKLLTTIAVLQCVERGLIGLDDDVAPTLPELAELEILTGMDSSTGKPILKKRQNTITVRHLLTHSSGLIYDFFSPLHQQYHAYLGKPANSTGPTILIRYTDPLVCEPGTSWHYGPSIDWAGILVVRLSQSPDLESYMQTHIFAPLGVKDITFFPYSNPEINAKMTAMSIRDPQDASGKIFPYPGPDMFAGITEPMGGQGAYGSMPSYLKVLHSILADDGKLLRSETTEMMFEPQLSEESRQVIQDVFTSSEKNALIVGEWPKQGRYNWGLGGVLNMQDIDMEGISKPEGEEGGEAGEWRRKGCLNWSGLPNLFWFIDRKANLCGIYGGQVLPPGDLQTKEMILLWEKTMYERARL